MLRRIVCASQNPRIQWVRWSSKDVTTSKVKWDIMAGVLVERLPVITRDLTPFEQKYAKMLADIEFEQSMKSDYEIRHERDLVMAEKLKKGDVELDLDETVKQTAQDMKDAYKEELKKFQFASRKTEEAEKGNRTSAKRKMDETLILLVEQKVGEKTHFLLPQGLRKDSETLRETAERVVKEKCGDSLPVQVYGNAPIGFYKYKYPGDHRQTAVGAKIFFYRAALTDQNNTQAPICHSTHEWLSKFELSEKLPLEYLKSVNTFVF